MTQNSYLNLIREYSRLSARFNRSYADQVLQIETLRRETITEGANSKEQMDAALTKLMETTDREYGKRDVAWGKPSRSAPPAIE